MSLEEILIELKKLNRSEKFKAAQILVNELALEEDILLSSNIEYELITPYDDEAAAAALWNVLQASKNECRLESRPLQKTLLMLINL